MKLLITLIRFGFPLLLFTDFTSNILSNVAILNVSRGLRLFILILFVIENIKYYSIIKKFYFFKTFALFAFVLFLYIFTDRNIVEGIWMFLKLLFWVLGLNVLFAYAYIGLFKFSDFFKVIKTVAIIAFGFTIYFYVSGYIEDDYNVAAYLVLSFYPVVLYSSNAFTKNRLLLLLCMISVFITVKRGAVIAFSLASILYYIGSLYSSFSIKKLFFGILILSAFAFSAIYFIEQQSDRLEDRLSTEQFDISNERAGSGRVGAYTRIYEAWYNSDNIILGFGNQEDSHRNRGRRTHAHSDIFGFLYNFGLVGIFLILFVYRKIILFHFKYRKFKEVNRFMVLVLFVILVLVNIYSGLFYLTETIYLLSLFPYLQIRAMRYELINSGHVR
ncbi:O-antigen ligase family protein [Winogradskyella ouciana]|uniref:O-antigen ligase family protein n=1 Tax=Winogradskyella ouciana TaxID=2608631 RepID=UPI003D2740A2